MYIAHGGKMSFDQDKYFLTHFSLTSTPILNKIDKGCEYLTPYEPFYAVPAALFKTRK